MYSEIKNRLLKESENDYKKFCSSLIPNIDNILGIRLPILRKIAREIYKSGSWQDVLSRNKTEFMEETMLQGMVIGLIKDDNFLDYVKDFIPKIDNWSVCDSFCVSLKQTKAHPKQVWEFIQPYFKSGKEYEKRFAYVMLLTYFTDDVKIALTLIDSFKDERYYAQMGCAWALSVIFVKHPKETLEYLKHSKLDNFTFNKSIQKIRESFRVDRETKNYLKTLLRG